MKKKEYAVFFVTDKQQKEKMNARVRARFFY